MIGSTRQVAVYAYGAPADLRKGFDGLTALVTQGLRRDPLSGDLYVFANRTRKRAKVLLWDGTGLCIYAKRLERGRFACLWRDDGTKTLRLTLSWSLLCSSAYRLSSDQSEAHPRKTSSLCHLK